MIVKSLCCLTLPLALFGACDSQAEDDYQGEPLAQLSGVVKNDLDRPVDDLDAVLIWAVTSGTPDRSIGEGVEVTGDFPASFRLDLFHPPVEEALNDYGEGESRMGVAYVTALPHDYVLSDEEPEIFGISEGHLLVYLEDDVQPGSMLEEFLGGALEAGFHLMDVIDAEDPACADEVFDCMREAAGGLDTEIEVRIDESEALDIPNWT